MLLGNTSLLHMIQQKMSWLSTKSIIHSQNIASSDIQNYRQKEIRPFEELLKTRSSMTLGPETFTDTNESHTKEWEVMMQAEATAQHQAMSSIYKKYMGMLHSIMGGHSS